MGNQRVCIVTEKPEVSRLIAEAFSIPYNAKSKTAEGEGWGKDVAIYSLEGNPFRLEEPQEIDPRLTSWAHPELCLNIPKLPRTLPSEGAIKLLRKISKAMQSAGVVIIATDSDLEGEAIAHDLAKYAGVTNSAFRVSFTESLSTKDIMSAFKQRRSMSETAAKWRAAQAKRVSDWYWQYLVRAHTANARDGLMGPDLCLTKNGRNVLSSGRVQTIIQKIITEHHLRRLNHIPTDYYNLSGSSELGSIEMIVPIPSGGDPRVTVNKQGIRLATSKTDIERVHEQLQQYDTALVHSLEQAIDHDVPEKPFDALSLQSAAAKKSKFKPSHTMKIANSIRMKGYITYVRTDEVHLPMSLWQDKEKLLGILDSLKAIPSLETVVEDLQNDIRDDRYPTPKCFTNEEMAHHGIIPNDKPVSSDLTPKERAIYELIATRFVRALMKPAVIQKSKATLSLPVKDILGTEDVKFRATASTLLEEGHRRLSETPFSSEVFSEHIREGLHVQVSDFEVTPRRTSPPGALTVSKLMEQLKRPSILTNDHDVLKVLTDARGIGTAATRDRILDKVISRGYSEIDDNGRITPTAFGISYIEWLSAELFDVNTTARIEKAMRLIERSSDEHSAIRLRNSVLKGSHSYILKHVKEAVMLRTNKGVQHQ